MPYEFEGPEKFAEKVAGGARKPEAKDQILASESVQGVATLLRRMQDADDRDEKDRCRAEIVATLDHLDMESETCRAMVAEAFPPLGFSRPSPLAGRKFAAIDAGPRPQAPPGGHPYDHEQPTDEAGNPLTLDENNPAHKELIKKLPKYGSVPSEVLAWQQSGTWQETSALRAGAALAGLPVAGDDLLRRGPRQATLNAPGGVPIDPADVDRQWDAYLKSPEGRREMGQQTRRATGADVSPSGAGMTGVPNTGVNQDINSEGFVTATQADEMAPQAMDPFQGHRGMHVEPPAPRQAQATMTPAGQQPRDTPAQKAAASEAPAGGDEGKARKGK